MKHIIISFLVLFLVISCKKDVQQSTEPYTIIKSIENVKAGIATAHPEASRIGLEVMKKGGNAVDAAIATQFALAVCYPVAGNIGGGGFMIIRLNNGETAALDFRESAPSKAHRDMYLDPEGNIIDGLSLNGHLASGIPGSVDGMVKAFEKYSKLKDWNAILQPAIDLAKNGVFLTENEAESLNRSKSRFEENNTVRSRFISDVDWNKGDKLIQPELASVLEAIRDQKEDGFYKGWVADSIVAEMTRGGGIITHDDLANYEAIWRPALVGSYKNYDIISMPPSSSGGIALQQLLSSIEPYPISDYGFHSTASIHLLAEAERRVFADRATHLGDMDFYPVPIMGLMDDEYNKSRMSNFDETKASKSEEINAGTPSKESEQTTHFSIVDEEGNAVSVTTTINTGFGSKVVVGGAGFFLNNEMDDFSSKAGVPNFYGLVGNEANSIAPGKRMLSSMTPTIVAKDGKLVLVVGTPGGSTIITSVFQVIVNVIEYGMSVNDAVQSCRFHHQWLPDQLYVESDCIDSLSRTNLMSMGHKLESRGTIGRVEAIKRNEDGSLNVAADRRGDDSAMGY